MDFNASRVIELETEDWPAFPRWCKEFCGHESRAARNNSVGKGHHHSGRAYHFVSVSIQTSRAIFPALLTWYSFAPKSTSKRPATSPSCPFLSAAAAWRDAFPLFFSTATLRSAPASRRTWQELKHWNTRDLHMIGAAGFLIGKVQVCLETGSRFLCCTHLTFPEDLLYF